MEQPVTKRVALSTLHRIFDPCGLALPVTIVWRVLLQKTWKEAGAEWDIALSPALQEEWMQLAKGLKELAKLTIPRYVGMNLKECTNELIGFCDASAKAYAANIYLRSVRPDGTIVTTLLFAKGRVAPQDKVISIPRLELLANLIMIRCLGFIAEQVHLPIVRHTVFTDSQCVLHWLRSTKRLSVFVSNRIREIRECEEKYQLEYNYVNTKENPADIPSKGIDAADLIGNRLWEEGPTYLREDRSRWPIQPLPPIDSNMKADIAAEECMYSATLLVVEENDNCLYGIDVSKFSSFGKLVNTFGYVRKFVNNCKSRLQKRREGQQPVEVDKLLTVDERREARMLLVREVQRTGLPEVLEALTTSKKCSVVQQLRLYLDEQQLIRCRGRIDRSEDLHHDAKRPILLPRKHIFTRLLVQHVHEELMHAGPSHTLAALRYQFWIPQGKTMIKQVLHRCRRCRRVQGPPFKVAEMPQLPKSRISEEPAFTHTGIDFFGPVYVRTSEGKTRCDVLLLTCMSTRAVHLELVDNMTAEVLIMALRRFFALRGTPKRIVSDNAKSFKLADQVLTKSWESVVYDPTVQTDIARRAIKWQFITDLAPWCGGFYERLVGVVKTALRKAIGTALLNKTELNTVLHEAASVVNGRPLVYAYEEVDSPVLTPSMFLTANPKPYCAVPEVVQDQFEDPQPSSADVIRARWKRTESCLTQFWKTFTDHYLLSLRERYQRDLRQARSVAHQEPRQGEVVLIKENLLPRSSWRIGRIDSVNRSPDGVVRTAKVLTPNGNILLRSITHLYPLETDCPDEEPVHEAVQEGVPAVPLDLIPGGSDPVAQEADAAVPLDLIPGGSDKTQEEGVAAVPSELIPEGSDQPSAPVPVRRKAVRHARFPEQETLYVCPVCDGAYDEFGSDQIGWIGCDRCDEWYHWKCVGVWTEPTAATWFCPHCEDG